MQKLNKLSTNASKTRQYASQKTSNMEYFRILTFHVLNLRKRYAQRMSGCGTEYTIPAGIYLLKVNKRNTRTRC